MVQTLAPITSITLAVTYALTAVIRGYVGWRVMWVRPLYWVSVPICLWLSANQWWRLALGAQHMTSQTLFGQTGAIVFLTVVGIQPALLALRDHNTGIRR